MEGAEHLRIQYCTALAWFSPIVPLSSVNALLSGGARFSRHPMQQQG